MISDRLSEDKLPERRSRPYPKRDYRATSETFGAPWFNKCPYKNDCHMGEILGFKPNFLSESDRSNIAGFLSHTWVHGR